MLEKLSHFFILIHKMLAPNLKSPHLLNFFLSSISIPIFFFVYILFDNFDSPLRELKTVMLLHDCGWNTCRITPISLVKTSPHDAWQYRDEIYLKERYPLIIKYVWLFPAGHRHQTYYSTPEVSLKRFDLFQAKSPDAQGSGLRVRASPMRSGPHQDWVCSLLLGSFRKSICQPATSRCLWAQQFTASSLPSVSPGMLRH